MADGGASAPVFNTLPEYSQQTPYFNNRFEAEPCLSEDEIMDALAAHVSQHLCYGSGVLKEMRIRDVQNTPISLYTLDLFIEERKCEWVTEPYRGEYLESRVQYNTPIDPWSIPVPPPLPFARGKKILEVPGTLSVVNCAQCLGIGSIQCGNCTGSAMIRCVPCFGTGTVEERPESGSGHTSRKCQSKTLFMWLVNSNMADKT
jgi:hypothetical protein